MKVQFKNGVLSTTDISLQSHLNSHQCNEECEISNYTEAVKHLLTKLSDEQRMEVFSDYCKYCGTKTLPCYCMNDD